MKAVFIFQRNSVKWEKQLENKNSQHSLWKINRAGNSICFMFQEIAYLLLRFAAGFLVLVAAAVFGVVVVAVFVAVAASLFS